jgi:hypothetical protein|tara:strand:- start:352 stop:795 length:444 start_codon:yes stop_codon:yes gene_type:complete
MKTIYRLYSGDLDPTTSKKYCVWGRFLVRSAGFLMIVFIFGAGCSDLDLDRAFEGAFPSSKNNKIINGYCASCHIHRDFDPQKHLVGVRSDYKSQFFRTARECRACHYIEKEWLHNAVFRKTRRPKDANRGVFRPFEKKEMKHRKRG